MLRVIHTSPLEGWPLRVLLNSLLLLSIVAGMTMASPSERRQPSTSDGTPMFEHCNQTGVVALTFSGGPTTNLPEILKILEREQVKGTFFFDGMVGEQCIYDEESANSVNLTYTSGHEIASGSWTHRNMTELGDGDLILKEMVIIRQAIRAITGATPAFMRPPYGVTNETVNKAALANMEYAGMILWDYDPDDWKPDNPLSTQKDLYKEHIDGKPDSILSIQHEFADSVLDLLPYIIPLLKEAGYRFVPVSECLGGLKPYLYLSQPTSRDRNWECKELYNRTA